MNMNWLNTNYILRAGILSILLLLPGLISATCKTDTIINSYENDSLHFIINDDSIITFRTGDSIYDHQSGLCIAGCTEAGQTQSLR